ncbi:ribonuclease H-like domain-containing protein [Tanacetum coccineum]
MNDEMQALYKNNTWILTDLPKNRKAIGSKWVYRIKYKSTAEINRYKARIVAKRHSQREGIEYEETSSPVVKMGTVRCLISLAVQNNWKLSQLDVNNAFLYGSLDEDAPMHWNNKLSEALIESGSEQSGHDHSLYTKESGGNFVSLLVYVDDIVVTRNDVKEIDVVKVFLSIKFKIKDLDEFKYFLGIEVLKTEKDGMCLSQRKYYLEFLHDFGLLACKLVSTPLLENIVLAHKESNDDKFLENVTSYQRIVEKLIYLNIIVHFLSQHMHAPSQSHMDIALRVLKYLKGASGSGVEFEKSAGYCVFFNGCLISWKSKKQATLSKSSIEAEHRSMAAATCECSNSNCSKSCDA